MPIPKWEIDVSNLPSRSTRRLGVLLHFASLAAVVATFSLGEYGSWDMALIHVELVAFLSLALTFYFLFVRTGFWRLTRAATGQLAEREIRITHAAHRLSYGIFSLVSLLLIVLISVSIRFSILDFTHTVTHRGHYSFGLILLIALNHLAHTLPAAVLAWTEEEAPGRSR